MIIDTFLYFNEKELVDLRIKYLKDEVDFFVIVESTTDHQGNNKKLNFKITSYRCRLVFSYQSKAS